MDRRAFFSSTLAPTSGRPHYPPNTLYFVQLSRIDPDSLREPCSDSHQSERTLPMLRISKEQRDAFLLHDRKVFIEFMVEYLQEESPGLIDRIEPEALREMIANGLARGRSHGLKSAYVLASFISVMFSIAPNFDEQPDIRRALRDERVPEDQRMSQLFDTVPDRAWDEAEKQYDPNAWFPELQEQQD